MTAATEPSQCAPPWLIDAPGVDITDERFDASGFLDSDEFGLDWRRCRVPAEAFRHLLGDGSALLDHASPDEEIARCADIEAWMDALGGAAAALDERPVLCLRAPDGLRVLDGWHRTVIAVARRGLTEIPALVASVPAKG